MTTSRPTCGGIYDLTAPSGSFSDGSGSSIYSDNLYCRWLIQPSGANYVQIDLSSFDTYTSGDKVIFYDGITTSAPVITGPLYGEISSGVIPSIFSTGNAVLVVFQTDSSSGDPGWTFSYTGKTGTPPP